MEPARRFAVIFAKQDQPLARQWTSVGVGTAPAVDAVMKDTLTTAGVRGASLSVVNNTHLVFARGYTWAEPGYPDRAADDAVPPRQRFEVVRRPRHPPAHRRGPAPPDRHRPERAQPDDAGRPRRHRRRSARSRSRTSSSTAAASTMTGATTTRRRRPSASHCRSASGRWRATCRHSRCWRRHPTTTTTATSCSGSSSLACAGAASFADAIKTSIFDPLQMTRSSQRDIARRPHALRRGPLPPRERDAPRPRHAPECDDGRPAARRRRPGQHPHRERPGDRRPVVGDCRPRPAHRRAQLQLPQPDPAAGRPARPVAPGRHVRAATRRARLRQRVVRRHDVPRRQGRVPLHVAERRQLHARRHRHRGQLQRLQRPGPVPTALAADRGGDPQHGLVGEEAITSPTSACRG